MARVAPHPKGVCRQSRCGYCHPGPKLARVHANVVVTIDMAKLTRSLGIKDYHHDDAKRWVQEDIEALMQKLPYGPSVVYLGVSVRGLRGE